MRTPFSCRGFWDSGRAWWRWMILWDEAGNLVAVQQWKLFYFGRCFFGTICRGQIRNTNSITQGVFMSIFVQPEAWLFRLKEPVRAAEDGWMQRPKRQSSVFIKLSTVKLDIPYVTYVGLRNNTFQKTFQSNHWYSVLPLKVFWLESQLSMLFHTCQGYVPCWLVG